MTIKHFRLSFFKIEALFEIFAVARVGARLERSEFFILASAVVKGIFDRAAAKFSVRLRFGLQVLTDKVHRHFSLYEYKIKPLLIIFRRVKSS